MMYWIKLGSLCVCSSSKQTDKECITLRQQAQKYIYTGLLDMWPTKETSKQTRQQKKQHKRLPTGPVRNYKHAKVRIKWATRKNISGIFHVSFTTSSQKYPVKYRSQLPRNDESWLMQAISGHSRLRDTMYKLNLCETRTPRQLSTF